MRFSRLLVVMVFCISAVWGIAEAEIDEAGVGKIDVFDFKDTPMIDVLKLFTELTGQNVVASENVMNFKITLFLKDTSPMSALRTMCKLYNLWYTQDGQVIRVMRAQDYGKELSIRHDEKTMIYNLKYASSLAVADLIANLMGECIEYVEPDEFASYGHVGTEEGTSGSSRNRSSGSRGARVIRHDATYAATREAQERVKLEKALTSKKLEDFQKAVKEGKAEPERILTAETQQAVAYMTVFPRNNCVVARSVDTRILRDINDLIEQLDTPTSQILLECKILEVTLTDDFDSFFKLDIANIHTDKIKGEGAHTLSTGRFTAESITGNTLAYTFVDKLISARMELLETNNLVKTIGTPMLLCANNAPGEFFIGEERPITTNYEYEVREFEGSSTETTRPVVELKEIGKKLEITPSINEDRTVTMRFLTEISTVNAGGATISHVTNTGVTVSLPIDTVDTTKVESIIIAKDRSSLAIGGFVREHNQNYEQKVPILGDIPLLGFFFKKKTIRKTQTETVILITPHIMMSPGENQEVSKKALSKLSEHPYIKHDQNRILRYNENLEKFKPIEEGKRKKSRGKRLLEKLIQTEIKSKKGTK